MASSSSASLSAYSADESGYITSRPRVNLPHVQEEDSPIGTDSEMEVTSERASRQSPRVSPITMLPQPTPTTLQPSFRGPRIRLTARKSVPMPRRVTLGMAPRQEAQCIQTMAAELHNCHAVMAHQEQAMTELVELTHLLLDCSTRSWQNARVSSRSMRRMELLFLMIGGTMLVVLLLFLAVAYWKWF